MSSKLHLGVSSKRPYIGTLCIAACILIFPQIALLNNGLSELPVICFIIEEFSAITFFILNIKPPLINIVLIIMHMVTHMKDILDVLVDNNSYHNEYSTVFHCYLYHAVSNIYNHPRNYDHKILPLEFDTPCLYFPRQQPP